MPPSGDCLTQLETSHIRQAEALRQLVEGSRIIRDEADRPAAVDYGADEVADAVGFWNRAVERHFSDEEDSLFPRLAARIPELSPEIASIVGEHELHRRLAREVGDAFARWRETRAAPDAALLAARVDALATTHAQHVEREDPLLASARRVLTEDDLLAIATEMENRRGRRQGR